MSRDFFLFVIELVIGETSIDLCFDYPLFGLLSVAVLQYCTAELSLILGPVVAVYILTW